MMPTTIDMTVFGKCPKVNITSDVEGNRSFLRYVHLKSVNIPGHVQVFCSKGFHIAVRLHQFHLKWIPNWLTSNHMGFHILLSNQPDFLVMFQLFVHHVSLIRKDFHRFEEEEEDSALTRVESNGFSYSPLKEATMPRNV
jgi:hypothetical protein